MKNSRTARLHLCQCLVAKANVAENQFVMNIEFYKYHGTGNSFILIDNRSGDVNLDAEKIRFLCDKNFGIGSDGLIFMNSHSQYDFEMKFYNPDGSEATFCGNGGRCVVAFAKYLKIIDNKTLFWAKDGLHEAYFRGDDVVLKMIDVEDIRAFDDLFYVNTGTHHAVKFVDDVAAVEIMDIAPPIRYSKEFEPHGTNVNFVQKCENSIKVRTYEKGVEQETLSCGTGVVASALVYSFVADANRNFTEKIVQKSVKVEASGGDLTISFERTDKGFQNIFLQGNAVQIFKGSLSVELKGKS